jgi:hypothetical protein
VPSGGHGDHRNFIGDERRRKTSTGLGGIFIPCMDLKAECKEMKLGSVWSLWSYPGFKRRLWCTSSTTSSGAVLRRPWREEPEEEGEAQLEGKCSPELQELDEVVDGGGEVTAVANRATRAPAAGGESSKLASTGVLLGFDCLRGKT